MHTGSWVFSTLFGQNFRFVLSLDKTFVLFWGTYHRFTVPYPVEGSQVTITPNLFLQPNLCPCVRFCETYWLQYIWQKSCIHTSTHPMLILLSRTCTQVHGFFSQPISLRLQWEDSISSSFISSSFVTPTPFTSSPASFRFIRYNKDMEVWEERERLLSLYHQFFLIKPLLLALHTWVQVNNQSLWQPFPLVSDLLPLQKVVEFRVYFTVCYFQQNKNRRGPGEGNCHAKTMMRTKTNESLK